MTIKVVDFYRMVARTEESELSAFLRVTAVEKPADLLLILEQVVPYITQAGVRDLVHRLIETEPPQRYLKFLPQMRAAFPDMQSVRDFLIKILNTAPWTFYIYSDQYKDIFGLEYFESLLEQDIDFFNDPSLLKIFKLYYADKDLNTLPPKLHEKLASLTDLVTDTQVAEPKPPGFACGGMEKNYVEAVKLGTGLCIVNDSFLAKKFHRKKDIEAQKVTFVSRKNLKAKNNRLIYEDYIYAPSNGSHLQIENALSAGETRITIPNLTVRPVRPLIGLMSNALFIGDQV